MQSAGASPSPNSSAEQQAPLQAFAGAVLSRQSSMLLIAVSLALTINMFSGLVFAASEKVTPGLALASNAKYRQGN